MMRAGSPKRRKENAPDGMRPVAGALARVSAVAALVAALLPLSGCTGFFTCEGKASCPSSGSGGGSGGGSSPSNTGDFAYVANSSAGTTYLSEYSIASNALNSLGTIDLGYIPVALAVAPSNSFLYVASAPGYTSPGIYLYTIGSTGTLSIAHGGTAVATDTVAAMAISPDGNWLFTVNSDGATMNEYQVNTSNGTLTPQTSVTLPISTCNLTTATPVTQTCSVTVAPSGDYVVASLGIVGDVVLSYSSSSGITATTYESIPSGYSTSNPTGDFSVALDENNYAYIARTSSVSVDEIQSNGVTNVYAENYSAGQEPRSITLSKSYNFVYTADEAAGTIAGFGILKGGALSAISGSAFAGPANVSALAVDNTGGYLVAVGYDGSAGVRLYTINSSTGVLAQVAQAGSGTSEAYPALVAMTH